MARLIVHGSQVVLQLSVGEKFWGFHASPRSEISEIASIEAVENFWSSRKWRGVRAPGTGIPKVIALGTWRGMGKKSFCAVYKNNPGYIITFTSGEFEAWLVSTPELPSDLARYVK